MSMDWSNVTDDDLKQMPESIVEKVKSMNPDKKPEQPMAATAAELKAAGFSESIRLQALDNGWTMAQAQKAHVDALIARVDQLEKTKAELEAKVGDKAKAAAAVAAVTNTGGAKPVATVEAGNEDPFEAAVRAEMANNGGLRPQAMGTVMSKQPALYAQWRARQQKKS